MQSITLDVQPRETGKKATKAVRRDGLVPCVLYGSHIDPVHFALIMCINLTIGLATPPVGLVLLVSSAMSGERIEAIVRQALPYYPVHVAVILLVTYVPAIPLTLPRLFGFAN